MIKGSKTPKVAEGVSTPSTAEGSRMPCADEGRKKCSIGNELKSTLFLVIVAAWRCIRDRIDFFKQSVEMSFGSKLKRELFNIVEIRTSPVFGLMKETGNQNYDLNIYFECAI